MVPAAAAATAAGIVSPMLLLILLLPLLQLPQSTNLDCHCYEWPAFAAYVTTTAACPQLIIVSHIDVNHQLTLYRLEICRAAAAAATSALVG